MTMKIFFAHKEDAENLKININNLMKEDEILSILESHVEYFINLNDAGHIHIGLINFDSLFNSKNIRKDPVVFVRIMSRKTYFFTKAPNILLDTLRENKIEKTEHAFNLYPLIMAVIADIPKGADGFTLITFNDPVPVKINEDGKLIEIVDVKSSKDVELVKDI